MKMAENLSNPHNFAACLAALHQNSKSPKGKFGFHVNNCMSNLPLNSEFEESWEKLFTKNMRHTMQLELAAQGSELEFENADSYPL